MELYEMFEIEDCPICFGGSLIEEENNCSVYVMCLECGCHTVSMNYKNEEERIQAAKRVIELWNAGKVIKGTPGE